MFRSLILVRQVFRVAKIKVTEYRKSKSKLATLGTKNTGRRQTKQKHNIDVYQIVNQTDDSGNVNIINSSILQLAIIDLSYVKQRKYIDVFLTLRSHVILHLKW